ncbi:MAG: hypothetical protein D3910_03285, partial [Candidatus Electrothrix sp. ATG2]|nr:hypothetical protein [Candidatus Electrothrix sp. ATG2]
MKKSKILASSVAPAKRAGRGCKVLRPGSGRGARWLVGVLILFACVLVQQHSAFALAELSVTPITWDVIGLDSNDVSTGPNQFPVGARVCNNSATEDATGVVATFNWDDALDKFSDDASPHSSINLRAGTDDILQLGTVPAGECVDAYYEAEVVRDPASYDTMRNYSVSVLSFSAAPASSPTRQLYVEHLVSQNRNATTDVQYGTDPDVLTSVEPGGTLSMMVGGTYYIKLVGSTATQGYEQLESFINIPNTIFRILEVTTDYTADTSATVGNPNDKLYGNGCLWENDINSENLRSCLSTGKVGGGTEVLYKVEILQMPGAPLINPEPIQTLYYDFSGSSYHYNADYSLSTRYIEIVTASIQKAFDPKVIAPGGTSKITFTITNPGPEVLTGVTFDDDSASTLPGNSSWPAGMTVSGDQFVGYSGCGEVSASKPLPLPTDTISNGTTALSFSNISIAGYGTCTIELDVTVAADGTYKNTTSHLLINGSTDTGSYGEDSLTVVSGPPGATGCAAADKVVMATWDFSNATQTAGTEVGSGTTFASLPATDPGDVGTPTAAVYTNGTFFAPATAGVVDTTSAPVSFGTRLPDDTPNYGKSIGINGGWPNDYTDYTAAGLAVLTDGDTSNGESSFFEFRINAAHYADVGISIDFDRQGDWNNIEIGDATVFASMDGGVTWEIAASVKPSKQQNEWDFYDANNNALTAVLSGVPTGEVIFRVLFAGAGKQTAATFIDNVTVSGCPSLEYPTLEKNFLPDPICEGTPSTLQFTIANPNTDAGGDLSNLSFTDTLPAGLSVTDQTFSACGGTDNVVVDAATRKITVTGGTLAPTASCTIDVEVIGAVAGTHTNTSGSISSAETGPSTAGPQVGYGQAGITVDPLAITPTMNADFSKTLLL